MKRFVPVSLLAAGAFLTTGIFLVSTAAAAGAVDLCNNTNVYGVQNQPSPRNMACTFSKPVHITQIVTYHWNNGRGKPPGTLGLKSNATGQTYGPFAVKGTPGQNNAPNVNWVADVNFCVPAGGYLILDSDYATWSMNAQSAYRGFIIIRGDYNPCVISKLPPIVFKPTPIPPKPPILPPKPPPPVGPVPCYVNSGAWAAVGPKPCFGPPGTMIDIFVLVSNPAYTPYTNVNFKTVPVSGAPALVHATLAGSSAKGSIMTVVGGAPPQLCLAKSNSKWTVWLTNATKELGQIGEFTITGCP